MAPTEKYIPSSVDVTEAPRKVTKQSLANTIREVSEYDQKQLVQELGKYAGVTFRSDHTGLEQIDAFRLVALYQKSLQLLGYDISITARFNQKTYTNLKLAQGQNLGMSPSDKNPLHRPDGIPGSYTTGKLIKTLQKNEPNPDSRSVIGFKVVPVSPATASRSPAVPDLIKAPASAAPPPRLAPALPVQAVPQAPPPRPAPALPATQVSPPQDPTGGIRVVPIQSN